MLRMLQLKRKESAKSAHLRIDRLDKLVFWIGTTVVGAIITGGIMALLNSQESDRIYGHFLLRGGESMRNYDAASISRYVVLVIAVINSVLNLVGYQTIDEKSQTI